MEEQKQLEYDELLEEYINMEKEYANFKKEHNNCLENVLIISLNDMKVMYESREKEINKLKEKLSETRETSKIIKIMIDTIISNLNNTSNTRYNNHSIESQLNFIKDVLEHRKVRYY